MRIFPAYSDEPFFLQTSGQIATYERWRQERKEEAQKSLEDLKSRLKADAETIIQFPKETWN